MMIIYAVLIVIIGTVLGAFGSLYLKRGSARFCLKNPINMNLFKGASLYGVSILLYTYALAHAPLSFIYPFVSLGYVWITIISYYKLKEEITLYKIIGLASIILGVTFIGLGM